MIGKKASGAPSKETQNSGTADVPEFQAIVTEPSVCPIGMTTGFGFAVIDAGLAATGMTVSSRVTRPSRRPIPAKRRAEVRGRRVLFAVMVEVPFDCPKTDVC